MLLIAMLVGCGPSWGDFRTAYAEELCASYEACDGEPDPTCVDAYLDAVDEEPPETFTAADAADCLDAVRAYGETCAEAESTPPANLCRDLL